MWRLLTPQLKKNTYIAYSVQGCDSLGPFGGERRYNHFNALRSVLAQNYPGVYVPGIPPKKAVGNKDIEFVIERRYFLERFFMQLSERQYLVNTAEMKIFARPEIVGGNTDVDKQLAKVPKPTVSSLVTFYKISFGMTDEKVANFVGRTSDSLAQLEETQAFLKTLL